MLRLNEKIIISSKSSFSEIMITNNLLGIYQCKFYLRWLIYSRNINIRVYKSIFLLQSLFIIFNLKNRKIIVILN